MNRKSQERNRKRKKINDLPLPLPAYKEAGPDENKFEWAERVPMFWELEDPEQLSLFPHKNFFEELKAL